MTDSWSELNQELARQISFNTKVIILSSFCIGFAAGVGIAMVVL